MAVSNVPFIGEKDPMAKAKTAYAQIGESSIEAYFTSETNKKKEITRDYIEMIIEEIAQATQNNTLFNKWLQIDTKFEKAMREYQSEVKGLLNGVALTIPMQGNTMQQPVSVPAQPQQPPIGAPETQAPAAPVTNEPPKSVGIE